MNLLLRPACERSSVRSVELFAGCGGLALGLSRAGFQHKLVVEVDDQAHATLAENKRRAVRHVADWPIEHTDVRNVDYRLMTGTVDLVAGGPPCQPFSIGGKHLGPEDARNMWPEAVRAVRALRPKAFLFENVRGLLRPAFKEYLKYLRLYLCWPEIALRDEENWTDHFTRLVKHRNASGSSEPSYRVLFQAINTADYGAHQKRHRAMAIGIRTDIAAEWTFPNPTHSRSALIWSQHISGHYWHRHNLDVKNSRGCVAEDDRIVVELRQQLVSPPEAPWLTVRDAIGDLPEPSVDQPSIAGHKLHPGARIYPRHTGSRWDEPAKALKAGDHGVPGGENILASEDGSVRYFSLREMARLQGFPDEFVIPGTWKTPIKQLGNAVPVQVGEILGRKIIRIIEGAAMSSAPMAA